jgi:hypothetical protein
VNGGSFRSGFSMPVIACWCSSTSSLLAARAAFRSDLETAHLWTIRDGRAKSARIYRDRSEALEAVGLRE